MEVLNYSLWFTLVLWSLNIITTVMVVRKYFDKQVGIPIEERKLYQLSAMSEIFTMIMMPAPVILLEYLIMR